MRAKYLAKAAFKLSNAKFVLDSRGELFLTGSSLKHPLKRIVYMKQWHGPKFSKVARYYNIKHATWAMLADCLVNNNYKTEDSSYGNATRK